MLRSNSKLRTKLGPSGSELLIHLLSSVERVLPHVEPPNWSENSWAPSRAYWTSASRNEICLVIAVGERNAVGSRSLVGKIRRRRVGNSGLAADTLDQREYDICTRIARRCTDVMSLALATIAATQDTAAATIRAIKGSFDEAVIAEHIKDHHGLEMPVSGLLAALHTLSEQTYENKALVFGCIIDPNKNRAEGAEFVDGFLNAKKFKALSDGFKTAYHVSSNGRIFDFVELDRLNLSQLPNKHYYPDWAKPMARYSRQGRCGIILTRQGDILVFDEGTVRFTYRYGRWRYWNHSHVVNLLRDRAKAQRVPRSIVGAVVGSIYRASLDVSFRRSGGLFVILHNQNQLDQIVRGGDAIGHKERQFFDSDFDGVVKAHKIQSLHRAVTVELASLDGAIVLANSGSILAYGAVLQPRKAGHIRGSEGSRTKAAIGASNYGLAVKISSDGDITVYFGGREFFRM